METTDNSQTGWRIESDTVELFLTAMGGHMAPVRFAKNTQSPIEPYYISPWQKEPPQDMPEPVLVPLRGDFFCMPFGGNGEAVGGEKHYAHGEPATANWNFVDLAKQGGTTTLTLDMQTKVRQGKVVKKIRLVDGHNAVYTSHILEGYSGEMPIGHHSILRVPEQEGALRIAVSPFELGMTPPDVFSNPVNAEYQSLGIGEKFSDLSAVPVIWKNQPDADCTYFPRRLGFTDLLQVCTRQSGTPTWTTATCQQDGYLWFSLKDASVLPSTLMWLSNKGRYGYPWNGRNRCLGLEETCSFMADGLGPSTRPNAISATGFATAVKFSPEEPTTVNFIQGAIAIPDGFEMVADVSFSPGVVTFTSTTGKQVTTDVDHEFLGIT